MQHTLLGIVLFLIHFILLSPLKKKQKQMQLLMQELVLHADHAARPSEQSLATITGIKGIPQTTRDEMVICTDLLMRAMKLVSALYCYRYY